MPLIQIVCSNCGYAREARSSSLPQKSVNVTCPKCQHVFVFDPANPVQEKSPVSPVTPPPVAPTAEEPASLTGGMGNRANKLSLMFFLFLVLVAVGIRLWADSRAKAVPYPNLMAASAEYGIAIGCGRTVYLYTPDGILVRDYPVPEEVRLTQLFWDKENLYGADMHMNRAVLLNRQGEPINFSGASFSAQFKIVREPATGRLFVSDGARHRVAVFEPQGRFLRSFGEEGIDPGKFRFPNEMRFDEAGQLLIANTKRMAIDAFSPDGTFLGTRVSPSDATLRYPTDFEITPDRLLVMENDGFLERAKVTVYDRKGTATGKLALGEAQTIGDLVVAAERAYVSDCLGRQVLAFSLADLRPLGPFSQDLVDRCAAWDKEARLFRRMSNSALIALLGLCAPIILIYCKMKRGEAKDISRVVVTKVSVGGSEVILSVPPDAGKRRVSLVLLASGVMIVALSALSAEMGLPPLTKLGLLLAGFVVVILGVIYLIRSGGITDWKRNQTDQAFKRIIAEKLLELGPAEVVEKVALAQCSQSANDLVLLVFTGHRLLLYYLSWNRVTRIRQVPYQAITKVIPPTAGLSVLRQMQVVLSVEGKAQKLTYLHQRADFLQLLCVEFSARTGKASPLSYAELCLTCRQPLQGDYCAVCALKLASDRQAVWLSVLFPGLGQIRNGEIQKGLIYCVITVVFLYVAYVGIDGWFFSGADLDARDKARLAVHIALATVWYIANIFDAHHGSIRGRKPVP